MPPGPVVAFRTEGGAGVGLGHVRRCLSLAAALREHGAESCFLLNDDPAVSAAVHAEGFAVDAFADDPHALIAFARDRGVRMIVCDSYRLSSDYFRALAPIRALIVAISDGADRSLPVDVVVNAGITAPTLHYDVPPDTLLLLGPAYALLRSEFSIAPTQRPPGDVRRILVTVGGSDAHALTSRLMSAARTGAGDASLDVVVGPFVEGVEMIEHAARGTGRVVLHTDPPRIRDLMVEADLAICGGGQTTYELAATATPAIAVTIAENQAPSLAGLEAAGTLVRAGEAADPRLDEHVIALTRNLARDPESRAAMGARGRALVDGRGAVRVARALLDTSRV